MDREASRGNRQGDKEKGGKGETEEEVVGAGGGRGFITSLCRRWEAGGRRRRNAGVGALKLWVQQVSLAIELTSLRRGHTGWGYMGVVVSGWRVSHGNYKGIGWHTHTHTNN